MKLHGKHSLTKALPIFRRLFPLALLREMDSEFVPQGYKRKASSLDLIEAMFKSILLRLPCLEAIVNECPKLGLSGAPSLSYNLDRPWFRQMAEEIHSHLVESKSFYDPEAAKRPRLLLDTMPVMLQITQRGSCPKYNNVAKGIGVMSVVNLDAAPDECAFRILKIMPGGWNDTFRVRDVELIPDGPLYVADRGFYGLETVKLWRDQGVHFLMRAKKQNLSCESLRTVSSPKVVVSERASRRKGRKKEPQLVRVESDEIVRLGKANSKHRSEVRLVKAWLSPDEDLWLVTDDYEAPVEQLLDDYLDRGQVEVYHRFLKQSLCLAHLYNFDQAGIEAQVFLTVVLANLLFLAAQEEGLVAGTNLIKIVDTYLKALRRELRLQNPWNRNTVAQRRNKPEHNRRRLKTGTTAICTQANL